MQEEIQENDNFSHRRLSSSLLGPMEEFDTKSHDWTAFATAAQQFSDSRTYSSKMISLEWPGDETGTSNKIYSHVLSVVNRQKVKEEKGFDPLAMLNESGGSDLPMIVLIGTSEPLESSVNPKVEDLWLTILQQHQYDGAIWIWHGKVEAWIEQKDGPPLQMEPSDSISLHDGQSIEWNEERMITIKGKGKILKNWRVWFDQAEARGQDIVPVQEAVPWYRMLIYFDKDSMEMMSLG